MRTEQLKLTAPSMTTFVQTMQSVLQQRAWQRSMPAETSGRSHAESTGSTAAVNEWDDQLVVVDQMVAMGFARDGASLAAMKTGNTGLLHISSCIVTGTSVTCANAGSMLELIKDWPTYVQHIAGKAQVMIMSKRLRKSLLPTPLKALATLDNIFLAGSLASQLTCSCHSWTLVLHGLP